jgi:predicted enzyme related to lactoylglutathione lyase
MAQARACAFYEDLFGWRPERVEAGGGSYHALELGNGLGGGVVECGTTRPLWRPYAEVSDVPKATERALSLGRSVVLEPRRGPPAGAAWCSRRPALISHSGNRKVTDEFALTPRSYAPETRSHRDPISGSE